MDIELKISKSDNEKWGFRLTGGVECNFPVTVIKLTENGIAEDAGLRINDIITQINNTPTDNLSHSEVHDLLIASENNLVVTVRRDLSCTHSPSPNDDDVNEEISKIMQASFESEGNFKFEKQVHFDIVDATGTVIANEETVQELLEQKSSEKQTQETKSSTVPDSVGDTPERKWSTFLQKPKNIKPKLKIMNDLPKGEPYRVVIKKQPKKQTVGFDNVAVQSNIEDKEVFDECIENKADTELIEEVDTCAGEVIEKEEEVQVDEQEAYTEMLEDIDDTECVSMTNTVQAKTEVVIDKVLEQKLLEVQKQLEVLAELPSAIQSTIDAVSQQLANIVSIRYSSATESGEFVISDTSLDVEDNSVTEVITVEGASVEKNEDTEEVMSDEDTPKKEIESDLKNVDQEDPPNVFLEEEDEIQDGDDLSQEVPHLDEILTEEEKEIRYKEQQLLDKQNKEELEEFHQRYLTEKSPLPLKPIERPIILPGGRRWSQPDDACPTVRHPKMSDEKIANTIETFSEVIYGKTKGLTTGIKSGPGPIKESLFTGIVGFVERLGITTL